MSGVLPMESPHLNAQAPKRMGLFTCFVVTALLQRSLAQDLSVLLLPMA